MKTIRLAVFAAVAAINLAGAAAHAQTANVMSGLTRTQLVKSDISAPGREALQVRVDFAPGTFADFHAHPGEEIAFVIEGTMEYQFEGQRPIVLKQGESLFIPAGVHHSAKNIGQGRASELATYIVEKGKPLVVPAH
jgi:quercetin dioxygenase-like cupin family protein